MGSTDELVPRPSAKQTSAKTRVLRKRCPSIKVIQFSPPIFVIANKANFQSVVQQLTGRKRAIDSNNDTTDGTAWSMSQSQRNAGKINVSRESFEGATYGEKSYSSNVMDSEFADQVNQQLSSRDGIEISGSDLVTGEQLIDTSEWKISMSPTMFI